MVEEQETINNELRNQSNSLEAIYISKVNNQLDFNSPDWRDQTASGTSSNTGSDSPTT